MSTRDLIIPKLDEMYTLSQNITDTRKKIDGMPLDVLQNKKRESIKRILENFNDTDLYNRETGYIQAIDECIPIVGQTMVLAYEQGVRETIRKVKSLLYGIGVEVVKTCYP